jgi:hypothetical protein
MSNFDHDIKEYWHERMPAEIKELFDKAYSDLMFGPSYYDEDDNEVSCFEEGAIPFNFTSACRKIGDWCNKAMVPLYVEPWCGILQDVRPGEVEVEENEDGEQELIELVCNEYYEWDEHSQKKILFGELAPYL